MIASPNTLLRNWDLLSTVLVPLMARLPGGPRSWFPADTAGAVALVAAWRAAAGDRLRGLGRPGPSGDVTAFAPPPSDGVSPLALRHSELRAIPPEARHGLFTRRHGGWVPAAEITDRILLTDPGEPVGLVVLPDRPDWDEPDWQELVGGALRRLCRGGFLLSPVPPRDALSDGRLEPSARMEGLFRATADPRWEPAGSGPEDYAETLTRYQCRADLVADYSSLARSLARRISRREENLEDLEQVAYLALARAARRFDHRPDVSFSGYATACIVGELKRHFRDRSWSVRVPRSLQEAYLVVRDTAENLAAELSRSPTVTEIAARAGLTEEAVLEAMEAGTSRWARSLDATGPDGDEEGTEIPVVEEGFDRALRRLQVGRLAGRLDEREALIVKRIYFDGVTQRRVAADMGVSQMHISRLLRRALEKLRS